MQIAVIEYARNVLNMEDANSTEFDSATPYPVVVFMPEGASPSCSHPLHISAWKGRHGDRGTALSERTHESTSPMRTAGSVTHKGGTMRLGSRRTVLQTIDCIAAKLYQAEQYIDERHRHRFVIMVLVGIVYQNLSLDSKPCHPFYTNISMSRYEVNPELVPQFEAAGLRFVGKDETGTRMEIVELKGHSFFVAAQVRTLSLLFAALQSHTWWIYPWGNCVYLLLLFSVVPP
jgi:CTP synthase